MAFFPPTSDDLRTPLYLRTLQAGIIHAQGGATSINNANTVLLSPIQIDTKMRITHFGMSIATVGGAGALFKCGIYDRSRYITNPLAANLLWESDDEDGTVLGAHNIEISPRLVLWPGIYWIAAVTNDNALQFRRVAPQRFCNPPNPFNGCSYNLGAYGPLTNPCPVVNTAWDTGIHAIFLVDLPKIVKEPLWQKKFVAPHLVKQRRFLMAVQSSLVQAECQTFNAVANRVYLTPFQIWRRMTMLSIGLESTATGGAGSNLRLGIYDRQTLAVDNPQGARLLWNSGAQSAAFQGPREFDVSPPLTLLPGLYWGALIEDNAVQIIIRWSEHDFFNSALDGCRYAAGAFAFIDPCPAVTRDINASPKLAIWGNQ